MLEGKRIVVTGAASGIGLAIATACAEAGATVGVNHRRDAVSITALADKHPGRVVPLRFDVRDAVALGAGVADFVAREGRIDGWVNNAGVNRPALLVTATTERIAEQVEVNLVAPILCARAVLPVMLRQRTGVIINVGSVAAARPVRGQSVYAATKGALESLTRALAVEYGRKGIRVHCLRPGAIDTPMLAATRALAEAEVLDAIPLRRLGRAEEVAALAVYLMSDLAAYVTGAVHTIDGGFTQA